MRKLLAVAFVVLVASGCSGGGSGTSSPLPHANSLTPTGSSQPAPEHTGPEVDLTVFGRDACKTLTKQQLRDNSNKRGLNGEQDAVTGGVECTWAGDSEQSSISVKLVLDLEGIKSVYDSKGKFGYFNPVALGPFPAVHFDTIPDITKGQCSTAVGTGAKTAVITTVRLRLGNPEYTMPCKVTDRIALLVVGNAQGGK